MDYDIKIWPNATIQHVWHLDKINVFRETLNITDHYKAMILLRIFLLFVFHVCLSYCLVCSLPAGKELNCWLSCMLCFLMFMSLSHVVSWARHVIWYYYIPINDTALELPVFWPSVTENRTNELRFSDSVSLSFKTRLTLVTCFAATLHYVYFKHGTETKIWWRDVKKRNIMANIPAIFRD